MPKPPRTPRVVDTPEESRQLDRQYVIGLVCMLLLVAAFPLYNRGEPARRARALAEMQHENVSLGRTMFTQHCASCHGDEGRGGRGAPTLAAREFLGSVTDNQLRWLIAGGIPGTIMSAYDLDLGGPLTAQEIARLTAYIRSLEEGAPSVQGWFKGAPAPMRAVARRNPSDRDGARRDERGEDDRNARRDSDVHRAPDDARGRDSGGRGDRGNLALAAFSAHCGMCHGTQGEGSQIAPSVRPLRPLLAERPDSVFAIIARGVKGTSMMPFSTEAGGQLDATTIRSLVAWMREVGPGTPRR